MPSPSPVAEIGIPTVAIVALALFLSLIWKSAPEVRTRPRRVLLAAVGGGGWLALTMAAAWTGRLADFDARPPPLVWVMAGTMALGVGVGVSRLGAGLAALPVPVLIATQAIRFPLELVMHRAFTDGVMPAQMSYGGWNFDIVVGGLALPAAWWVARTGSRVVAAAWLALAWTTLGAIAFISIASAPWIGLFGRSPELLNTWVAHAPYVWLPAGPVVFALIVQTALTRRLWSQRRSAEAAAGALTPASR